MKFYKLEVDSFTQYKYAWAELPDDAVISDTFPKCPRCDRAIGNNFWTEPYNIILKQPRNVGDFTAGVVGCDLIASEKFKTGYEGSLLSGIERFHLINVIKMGTKSKTKPIIPPRLYSAEIKRTLTQVIYEQMNVKWNYKPQKGYCKQCGPGGGGIGGIYESYELIVIDEKTWTGEDIFFAINFPGNILLSENGYKFITEGGFSNFKAIPCEESKFSYFD